MDVLQLLKRDHAEVTKLFQRFHGDGGRGRKSVVDKICQELEVHTEIEEELFYPAVREAGDQELARLVDEAVQEHGRAKQQIQALRGMSASAGDDDAGQLEGMVSTLEQDIEHHVTEEEGEMFPRVQETMDDRRRSELGRRVRDRKAELMGGGRATTRRRATTARKASSSRGGRTKQAQRGKGKQARRGRAKTTTSRAKSGTKSRSKRARGGRGR